jgi:Na+/melibiose symporter-like transporter
MNGLALQLLKNQIVGAPISVLKPFARQIINRLGGPLKTQRLNSVINICASLLKFLAGFAGSKSKGYATQFSIPRIALVFLADTVCTTSGMFDGVAGNMMNYQMLDYVELKTGVRSEGITFSVNNLWTKVVTNNLGSLTGNAFMQWTGYKGGYDEVRDENNNTVRIRPWSEYYPLVPRRMKQYFWPMLTLSAMVDNGIWLMVRSFVHYTPAQAEQTERILAQRRSRAEQAETAPAAE